MLRHTYTAKNEIRVQDRTWINLQEYYDVEYWSKKFGVTPDLLKLAVKESGSTVGDDVERYIKAKYKAK